MKLTKKIDCADECEIPEGKALVRIPPPRHTWNDVIRCPTCGDCFLVEPEERQTAAALAKGSTDAG